MSRGLKISDDVRLRNIALLYLNYRNHPSEQSTVLAEGNSSPLLAFLKRIEDCYSQLQGFDQMIINNDFFMEEYSDWWKPYCSRREFIKRRKEAVTNFLTLFDNYEEPKI